MKKRVMTDAQVQRRLRKIEKKVLKRAKRQIRRGELSEQALSLFLPSIAADYDHLRASLSIDRQSARTGLEGNRAELLASVDAELATLGLERAKLVSAYETAQKLAEAANITPAELSASDLLTIDSLRDRLNTLKTLTTEEAAR